MNLPSQIIELSKQIRSELAKEAHLLKDENLITRYNNGEQREEKNEGVIRSGI